MHTCISPNFDAQNPVGTSLTCTRPVCVFGFWIKINLFSTCVQKFRQVDKLNLLKMFLRNILPPRHTCMTSNFGGQTPKIAPTTVQTVFRLNFDTKITIFCAYVQMFDKHAMLKLHAMLLRNHCRNMHTCIAL